MGIEKHQYHYAKMLGSAAADLIFVKLKDDSRRGEVLMAYFWIQGGNGHLTQGKGRRSIGMAHTWGTGDSLIDRLNRRYPKDVFTRIEPAHDFLLSVRA